MQGRRHGGYLLVEQCFGLGHQLTQTFSIAFGHVFDGAIHYLQVLLA